jgi:signal transduction histidine kinase
MAAGLLNRLWSAGSGLEYQRGVCAGFAPVLAGSGSGMEDEIAAVKKSTLFLKALPIIIAGLFLSIAGICFSLKYGKLDASIPPLVTPEVTEELRLFYLNFYLSLAMCLAGLCGVSLLPDTLVMVRWVFLFIAFAGSICGGFVLNDYFSINLCIYSAFVLVALLVLPAPENWFIGGTALLVFILFMFHPFIMEPAGGPLRFFIPEPEQLVLLIYSMGFMSLAAAAIRYLLDKESRAEATIEHLEQVGNKMLLFNHRLQEYIKNTGEEAVRKDRLRFTSDLHDSSGYVFTNIIAITEAGISRSRFDLEKVRETFKLIQSQARDGLKRTRETLYMIRELREPGMGSIEAIFEMKAILEEITDIQIEIETGNIKTNYGADINRMIIRIVQEAFTNSVRHGQATRIIISFWDFQDTLNMTVRDNGVGARDIIKGIGLAGMEERLAKIGGKLEVASPADGGFSLKVTIPLFHHTLID